MFNRKLIKIHEPMCPSNTSSQNKVFDLRLIINKRSQQMHPNLLKRHFPSKNKIIIHQTPIIRTVNNIKSNTFVHTSTEIRSTISSQVDLSIVKNEINDSSVKIEDQVYDKTVNGINDAKSSMGNTNNNSEGIKNVITDSIQFDKLKLIDFDLLIPEESFKKLSIGNKSSEEESSDDGEPPEKRMKRNHPNRRLELERSYSIFKHCKANKIISENFKCEKVSTQTLSVVGRGEFNTSVKLRQEITSPKVFGNYGTSIWKEILEKSEMWKREDCWCQGQLCIKEEKAELALPDTGNYQSLLGKYQDYEQLKSASGDVKMDTFNPQIWDRNFYIPPAHAQLLWWQLTDEMSSDLCVAKVCQVRKWPQVVYKMTKHTSGGGYMASLTLHSKTFTTVKPSLTQELAKECVAEQFLEYLNLRPRPPLSLQPPILALQTNHKEQEEHPSTNGKAFGIKRNKNKNKSKRNKNVYGKKSWKLRGW